MKRPVLFLDIDGVLAPFGAESSQPEKLCPDFPHEIMHRLARIIDATHALIVLSSTWRASSAAKAVIAERFQSFGPPLDQFSRLEFETDPKVHSMRQWEIYDWLQKYQPERWLALDDEPLVEGPENSRYCHIFRDHALLIENSSLGLQEHHVDKAISILLK